MNECSKCTTIEELVEFFGRKTALLNSCLELRNFDPDSRKTLEMVDIGLAELQTILSHMEKMIETGKENLAQFKVLSQRIEVLKPVLNHAESNFPKVLNTQHDTKPKVVLKPAKKDEISVAPVPCPQPKRTAPIIRPLTLSEFNSVSTYMRGRLTYENVNKFVETFNKTIAAKYQLLWTARSQLGNAAHKSVQEMKKQETAETKGISFCVLEDLKTYGLIKPDNTTRNMLTILRHCTRIKEIRGPGPIVRYAVIT